MKTALIGADGQLGSDLHKCLAGEVVPLTYPEFDITQQKATHDRLFEIAPDVVINTAAFHRVDECEDNPERSFQVNSIAVRDLALNCRDLGAALVHFSTDYVFNGEKKRPYTEEDRPDPLSVYAASKLAGEKYIKQILPQHFIIRTCGLYGKAGCWGKGTNFVDSMIAFQKQGRAIRVVDDQRITPTATSELAEKIREVIEKPHYGLYHMTNEGDCTWYEFARAIFEIQGRAAEIIPVSSVEYGARARRPAYSVLENKHAGEVGVTAFRHWREALSEYLS